MNYQEHSIDIYKRRKENNPLVERPVIEGIRSKKKKREEFQNNSSQKTKVEKEKVSSFKNINSVNEFKKLMKVLLGLTSITNSWHGGIIFKLKQNGISGELLNL